MSDRRISTFLAKHSIILTLLLIAIVGILILAFEFPNPESSLVLAGTFVGVAAATFLSWVTTLQQSREKSANVRLMLALEIAHNLNVVRDVGLIESPESERPAVLAHKVSGRPALSFSAWRSLQGDLSGALEAEGIERTIYVYSLLESATALIDYSKWVVDDIRRERSERQSSISVLSQSGAEFKNEELLKSRYRSQHGEVAVEWNKIVEELLELTNPLAAALPSA